VSIGDKAPCGHPEWGKDGHCAEMRCDAYVNKCPVHKINGAHAPIAVCSLEPKP
jgi:hypothetical protein